jgi:hypothetical protein
VVAGLLRLAEAGRLGDGACVRADLLAPPVAATLGGAAPLLMSWPVGDEAQARRLAALGANALICEDAALVAALALGW